MVEPDSSDCVDVFESQQRANSNKAQSFVEDTRAQDEGVPEPTELHLHNQSHRRELHLNPYDWQQILEME